MKKLCTECGIEHEFPVPKFKVGQRVKMSTAGDGYHHRDKVGQETVITGIGSMFSMPCDEIEYDTEFGFGRVLESRLESI